MSFVSLLTEGTVTMSSETAGVMAGLATIGLTTMITFQLIWFILQVIADWKIFQKAGEPGWKSIVPILNVITEYGLSWNMVMGVVYMICSFASYFLTYSQPIAYNNMVAGSVIALIAAVLHIIQSVKLSKCFGHGIGFGILLILLGPIGRIILGFGDSQYIGPQ